MILFTLYIWALEFKKFHTNFLGSRSTLNNQYYYSNIHSSNLIQSKLPKADTLGKQKKCLQLELAVYSSCMNSEFV